MCNLCFIVFKNYIWNRLNSKRIENNRLCDRLDFFLYRVDGEKLYDKNNRRLYGKYIIIISRDWWVERRSRGRGLIEVNSCEILTYFVFWIFVL